jgi:hypothetical protein
MAQDVVGTAGLVLYLGVREAALALDVLNVGVTPLTIWEQSNSWGWPMPTVEVLTGADAAEGRLLRPAPRRWTRDGPSTRLLEPSSCASYRLEAGDLDAEDLHAVESQRGGPLWARAQLLCEPSPEAAAHGVWTGRLRSPVTRLDPPHPWMSRSR